MNVDSIQNNAKEMSPAIYAATSAAAASIQPNRTGVVGDTVHIPIHLTGTSIYNMVFYITYNHSILTPYSIPYMSVHPSFSVTGFNPIYNSTTLTIFIDSRSFVGITFTGQKIADLVFTYAASGTTYLHLRKYPDDPSPRSGIWDEIGVGFSPVTYTDNTVTVTSNITPTLTVQGVTIGSGQSHCYNATQTIYVAGNGTTFGVQPGGSATMIAGQNIFYYPGTTVQAGGIMHGYIAPNGPWCVTQAPSIASNITGSYEKQSISKPSSFLLYPNPASEVITVDLGTSQFPGIGQLEIYDMHGVKVLAAMLSGVSGKQFSIEALQPGVYLVRLTLEDQTLTSRLIKY